MQITSEAIQRWVRILLYYIFGGVGAMGIRLGGSTKELVISVVGFALTALWTKYGSTVSAMLTEVQKSAGVEEVQVKVDPTVITPKELSSATPERVLVKPT